MDRGQTNVPGSSAVAALDLQVLEELADEGRVEIFNRQIRGSLAEGTVKLTRGLAPFADEQ